MEILFFSTAIIIFIIAWVLFTKYYRYKKNESWAGSILISFVFSCVVLCICIISFVFIFSFINRDTLLKSTPPTAAEIEAQKVVKEKEDRKELLQKSFSAWDGSHIKLEEYIKNSMNDPKSYEHVETLYWDRGEHLIVLSKFRGKNAFGGVVLNQVRAKVGINGEVIKILDLN